MICKKRGNAVCESIGYVTSKESPACHHHEVTEKGEFENDFPSHDIFVSRGEGYEALSNLKNMSALVEAKMGGECYLWVQLDEIHFEKAILLVLDELKAHNNNTPWLRPVCEESL